MHRLILSSFSKEFLRIVQEYPSSGLCPSEGIATQFLGMMTALTDTSSPELPHSLNLLTFDIIKPINFYANIQLSNCSLSHLKNVLSN